MKKNIIIPIFIPHKGCLFDCIYCNQKSISGEINEITVKEIEGKINKYLELIDNDRRVVDVAFYGGSFTGLEKKEQIKYLDCVNKYVLEKKIDGIRISTRPDYIDNNKLDLLKNYKIKLIELGVQSLDNEVLNLSKRGHDIKSVYNAIKMIKLYNIKFGIQTMIGLLGDNEEKALKTAKEVVKMNPDTVRIYPTLVIKGTYLEKLYLRGEYNPLSLESAIDITSKLLDLYNTNNINVIRVGLQPTENISEGKDLISGPFHPAFRYLVESKLLYERLVKSLKDMNIKKNDSIQINTNKKNISLIVGMKKKNKKSIKEKFKLNDVIIKEDNDIKGVFEVQKINPNS
ncbi:MAG: radical SAM protein [Clostridiales bacterium]